MHYKIFIVLLFILSFPLFSQNSVDQQELIGAESDFYEKAFWTGMKSFRNEDYLEAVASLTQVLDVWSSSPEKHNHLGTATNVYSLALIKSGRQREAIQAVASFYEKDMLNEEGLYNCGLMALHGGDFQLAYMVFSHGANSVANPSFDFLLLGCNQCL